MKKNFLRWVVVCAAVISPAFGHHSTAMFDYSERRTIIGVVRAFQWSNPHCYIQILVRDENGAEGEWSIETGAPTAMRGLGWNADSLKRGDRVTMSITPLRSGEPGGLLNSVTFADGKVLQGTPVGSSARLPTLERVPNSP